jgi:hypothetical protein
MLGSEASTLGSFCYAQVALARALFPLSAKTFLASPSLPSDLTIAILRHPSTVTHRTQLRLITIRHSHGNGVACEGADTGVGKQTLAQSEGADYHIAPLQRMA